MKKVSFDNTENAFYNELNAEVKAYFTQKGIASTGDLRLYLKSVLLIGGALGIYITLLTTITLNPFIALALCLLLGFLLACIGFSVMHDACHGSYSQSKRVNYIMGLTMNALGSNAFIWKHKHNIIHHTYTNIDGVDDDIAKSPVLRHCYSQAYKPMHRWQHIYMVPLYAISSILWALLTDFDKYFKREVNGTPMPPIPVKEHIIFWGTKVLYIFFYMALPILCVGVSKFLMGYFVANAAMGLTMALVFQLAHVVEHTAFTDATLSSDKLRITESWAAHQMRTTSNFSMNNPVISWFVGGLNFQIEHHLFPKVSHVHYPALSPIVQRLAQKHGLPYYCIDHFGSAVLSHFKTMRKFGQSEMDPQPAMS